MGKKSITITVLLSNNIDNIEANGVMPLKVWIKVIFNLEFYTSHPNKPLIVCDDRIHIFIHAKSEKDVSFTYPFPRNCQMICFTKWGNKPRKNTVCPENKGSNTRVRQRASPRSWQRKSQKTSHRLGDMVGLKMTCINEVGNKTELLDYLTGLVMWNFFSEKHFIELLVGVGTLIFSSMESKEKKKQRQLLTSGGTKNI